MNAGILCIAVGSLVIALRGPLVLAPGPTLRAYRSLFASDARARALGCALAALGAWIVGSFWGAPDLAAVGISVLGWLVGGAGGFLVLLPGQARGIADSVLSIASESVDPAFLRVVGVLAVALGAALVYLGSRLLWGM